MQEYLGSTKERSYGLVVKDNDLIRKLNTKGNKFTLLELKSFAYICSKIEKDSADEQYKLSYDFEINEFCRICGMCDKNEHVNGKSYQIMKATLKKLSDRSCWIRKADNSGEILFRLIDTPETFDKKGILRITIHSTAKPYLFDLKNKFTIYGLINVLQLSSSHTFRIYEFLKSYAYQKNINVSLDEFRLALNIEEDKIYQNYPELNRKIIKPGIEEINKKTDLQISYKPKRLGRKVNEIHFNIKPKSGDTPGIIDIKGKEQTPASKSLEAVI